LLRESLLSFFARLALLSLAFTPPTILAVTPAKTQPTKPNIAPASPLQIGQSQKISSQGNSYLIEPAPAWITPRPQSPAKSTAVLNAWHYLLIDHQNLVRGKDSSRFVHIIRKIDAAAGLGEGSRFEAVFDPAYQKLSFHEITVRRGAQRIDHLKPSSISLLRREQRLEQSQYDGKITASVIVEGVQIGDEIEYRYTVTGNNPVFGDKFSDFDFSRTNGTDTDLFRVIYRYPTKNPPQFRLSALGQRQDRELDSQTSEISYARENAARYEIQNGIDPNAFLVDSIQTSDFQNWKEVADWGQQLFTINAREQTETKKLAEQIRKQVGSDDKQQLIEAALNFVQKEIRYFGVFFGESSHRPNSPDSILVKRAGDCKDKTVLLAALLAQLGLQPYPVLVSASNRFTLAQLLPSPYAFDHAIVGLVLEGTEYWLDGTRLYGAGSIQNRQAWSFRNGLRLRADSSDLVESPKRPLGSYDVLVNDVFEMTKWTEPILFTSTIRYDGEIGERVQSVLASTLKNQFESEVFEAINRRFPEAKETKPLSTVVDEKTGTVIVSKQWQVPDIFSFPEQRVLRFEHGSTEIFSQLRQPNNSVGDYFLGKDRRSLHKTTFSFPDNVFKEDKSEVKAADAHFTLTTRFQTMPTLFKSEVEYESVADRVPRSQFTAYSEKLREASNKAVVGFALGYIPLEKLAEVQLKLQEVVQAINSRAVASSTTVQAESRIREVMMTEAIDGNRLAPKARAQAYESRAIARNFIWKRELALEDAKKAVELDPKNLQLRLTLSDVQFSLGQMKESLATLADPLATADKDNFDVLYQRGKSHFYNGQTTEALKDFTKASQLSSSARRPMVLLWLALASGVNGEETKKRLVALNAKADGDTWPGKLLQLYLGERSEESLLAAAKDTKSESVRRSQLCEANFYIGALHNLNGDKAKAAKFYKSALDTEVLEYVEYRAAKFELSKL
jgi:lipoprotein NlpI/transglutaminase-like putative cysteine protease